MGTFAIQGFEEFRPAQLWSFVIDVCRRKLQKHMESSGLSVPPQFQHLPLLQLWPAMGRISTHSNVRRLIDAGITLPAEARSAQNMRQLNSHVLPALRKSVKKALKGYGVSTRGLDLGTSGPSDRLAQMRQLRSLRVKVDLRNVPAVKEAWEAHEYALDAVAKAWPSTMSPLLVCFFCLFPPPSIITELLLWPCKR